MRRQQRRAYTLVELLAALSIAGVVALTAAPAIDRLARARHGALETEVRRLLAVARAHAVATGQPTGLRIDPAAETLELVRIGQPGAAPEPLPSPTGDTPGATRVDALIAGTEIVGVVGGDGGASGAQTLWFGYAGTPDHRSAQGAPLGEWTQDASITLSGQRTITIRRTTGAIQ